MNIYTGGRLTLFHLDLYRLDTPEQIAAAGLEEYLKPAGVTVIEWAERWFGQVQSPKSKVQSPTWSHASRADRKARVSTTARHRLTPCAGSRSKSSARRSGASPMKILALEFSSPQRSVAVVQGGADAGPLGLGEAIETGGSLHQRAGPGGGGLAAGAARARANRVPGDWPRAGVLQRHSPGHRAGARLATGAPRETPRHQHRRMPRRPGPGRGHLRAGPGRD